MATKILYDTILSFDELYFKSNLYIVTTECPPTPQNLPTRITNTDVGDAVLIEDLLFGNLSIEITAAHKKSIFYNQTVKLKESASLLVQTD